MLTKLKKLILSFLVALLLLTNVSANFVHAADVGTWYNQGFFDFYVKVNDPTNPDEIFGERYTAAQTQWIFYGMASVFINYFGDPPLNRCLMMLENRSLFWLPNALGGCGEQVVSFVLKISPFWNLGSAEDENYYASSNLHKFLETTTKSPVSGTAYLRDVATNIKIVPEAQAQGFGFGAMNPVLQMWRMVRNTTYFLLIFVVIIMAFMIMFRVKLSPQTVITVQSALPKIFITLILITFSYAIAGFMIDLMYVVVGLIAAILAGSGMFGEPFNQWSTMFGAITNDRSALSLMLYYFITFSIALLPAIYSTTGPLGFMVFTLLGGQLIAMLIIIIAFIVLLVAALRIFWLLLRTYVMIILSVIFGPIQILTGSLGYGGFGSWIKGLAAHLAVYPIVGFMFVISFVFLRGAVPPVQTILPDDWDATIDDLVTRLFPFNPTHTLTQSNSWSPPLTATPDDVNLMWLGVSFVIILLIPQVANMIKGMIEGKQIAYGNAIGAAIVGPANWAYNREGVQSGLGYGATSAGVYLQQRGGRLGGAIGKGLVSWGEPRSQVVRNRDSGAVVRVGMRGRVAEPPVIRSGGGGGRRGGAA
jgi:hypothetical protein